MDHRSERNKEADERWISMASADLKMMMCVREREQRIELKLKFAGENWNYKGNKV